jgi:Helix-turn-helix domain
MIEKYRFLRLVRAVPLGMQRTDALGVVSLGSSDTDYLIGNSCPAELNRAIAAAPDRRNVLRVLGRTAAPLKATEPATRDPDVVAELWPLPARVVLRGNELGLSQKKLAELTGCKQPKISKLLSYQGLHTLDAGFVIRLARALEMSTDELLTGRRPRIVYDAPDLPKAPPESVPPARLTLAPGSS